VLSRRIVDGTRESLRHRCFSVMCAAFGFYCCFRFIVSLQMSLPALLRDVLSFRESLTHSGLVSVVQITVMDLLMDVGPLWSPDLHESVLGRLCCPASSL
jgi:hypothetical protein